MCWIKADTRNILYTFRLSLQATRIFSQVDLLRKNAFSSYIHVHIFYLQVSYRWVLRQNLGSRSGSPYPRLTYFIFCTLCLVQSSVGGAYLWLVSREQVCLVSRKCITSDDYSVNLALLMLHIEALDWESYVQVVRYSSLCALSDESLRGLVIIFVIIVYALTGGSMFLNLARASSKSNGRVIVTSLLSPWEFVAHWGFDTKVTFYQCYALLRMRNYVALLWIRLRYNGYVRKVLRKATSKLKCMCGSLYYPGSREHSLHSTYLCCIW